VAPPVEFWFEYASTYSYPAAMRVEAAARAAGVPLRYRPFLLGPIFGKQGWKDSPFNIYPVKGRYMWRDMERICGRLGVPFARPSTFPRNGLAAARATVALPEAARPAFVRSVYEANFAKDRDISAPEVVAELLGALGHDAPAVLSRAGSSDVKDELRAQTDRAVELGIFGSPSFVVGGELFWGNDRLDDALEWARREA
jgi:2-hydroxychromene-2-carboxylate isomerase